MAELDQQTLKALLDGGHISENTYKMGVKDGLPDLGKNSSSIDDAPGAVAPQAAEVVAPDVEQARAPSSVPESPSSSYPVVQKQPEKQPEPKADQPAPETPQPGSVRLASDAQAQPNQGTLQQSLGDMASSFKQGYDLQQNAVTAGAAAGMKQAAAESAYLQKSADTVDQMEKERVVRESARQAQLTEQNNKLQKMVNDYGNDKVDPNRIFHDMGTGQKVMTGIGLLLSSFSTQGGGNMAWGVIKDAIDKDIEAQRTDIDTKGNKIKLQDSVLGTMREQFGDQRQSEAATRLAYLTNVETKLKQISAQYKSPQIQAQTMQAYGQLEIEKQKQMLAFNQAAMTSGAAMSADDTMRKIMRLPDDHTKAEAMKQLGEYQQHQKALDGIRDAMKTIRETNTASGAFSLQDRSRKAAAETVIKSLTSELFGGKSEQEFKIIEGLFPNKTDDEATYRDKLSKVVNKFESQKAFPVLDGYGLVPKRISMGAPVR